MPTLGSEPCIRDARNLTSRAHSSQVLPGAAYCVASASMILLNKLALSSFDFHSVTMLLLFQCTFCVTAVRTTAALGFIELEVRGLGLGLDWSQG